MRSSWWAIKLVGDQVTVRRNLNRFVHRADAVVLPIVHVDPSFVTPPTLNREQLVAIVRTLLITAHRGQRIARGSIIFFETVK